MHDPALRARAKELRKQGVLIKVIAVDLGVSKATVARWLNPTLEKRERVRARKLKFSQHTKCPRCKRRKADNAKYCKRCQLELRTINRPWPRERIIEAIQAWALKHGHAPTHSEWQKGGKDHPAISSMLDGPNPPFHKLERGPAGIRVQAKAETSGKEDDPPRAGRITTRGPRTEDPSSGRKGEQ